MSAESFTVNARLLVREPAGERVFELRSGSAVLGREPGCDLQFLDAKLSRHHARFDLTPDGVRLTDLKTTNGTFVNGQRIGEALLKNGDEIQAGNQSIQFQAATPLDKTIALPTPPAVVPSPVVPPSVEAPPAPPRPVSEPPRTGTVFIAPSKLHDLSQKAASEQAVPIPTVPQHASDAELKTIALSSPVSPRPPATANISKASEEPSTQILAPPQESGDQTMALGTMPVADHSTTVSLPGDRESLTPVVRTMQKRVAAHIRFPHMPWRTKFVLILSLTMVFLLFVITVPLLLIQGKTTVRISLERGATLASALAAKNQYAVVNNQKLLLDTAFVAQEPGVKEALVLDNQGRILSPIPRSGEMVDSIEGIPLRPPQIRTSLEGIASSGDHNFVAPIKNDNAQTVGLAWITFQPSGLADSASSILVVLTLVILLAVLGSAVLVWSATSMTVKPLDALRDATESVIKGDQQAVEELAGFAEINALAQSINRLIERSASLSALAALPQPGPAGAPSVAPAPVVGAPVMAGFSPPVSIPSPAAGGERGQLVVDGNFNLIQVTGAAEKWLGGRGGELLNRHIIEAIQEQRLLEIVLDLINSLGTQPQVAQEIDFSASPALGGIFVLSASRLPSGDQISIQLTKK